MDSIRVPVLAHYTIVDGELHDRQYCYSVASASEIASLLIRGFGLDGADPVDFTTAERRKNVA